MADRSLMTVLGKGGSSGPDGDGDEPTDTGDGSQHSDEELGAVDDLMSAMKSKDADGVAEALKAFLEACGAYTPEG